MFAPTDQLGGTSGVAERSGLGMTGGAPRQGQGRSGGYNYAAVPATRKRGVPSAFIRRMAQLREADAEGRVLVRFTFRAIVRNTKKPGHRLS